MTASIPSGEVFCDHALLLAALFAFLVSPRRVAIELQPAVALGDAPPHGAHDPRDVIGTHGTVDIIVAPLGNAHRNFRQFGKPVVAPLRQHVELAERPNVISPTGRLARFFGLAFEILQIALDADLMTVFGNLIAAIERLREGRALLSVHFRHALDGVGALDGRGIAGGGNIHVPRRSF